MLYKILGAILLCVFFIMILRRESPESASLLRLAGAVVFSLTFIYLISPIVDYVLELAEMCTSEELADFVKLLLRILAISMLTHFSASFCRDAGEGSLALYAEICGKAEMLVCALPLFQKTLDMAAELLGYA